MSRSILKDLFMVSTGPIRFGTVLHGKHVTGSIFLVLFPTFILLLLLLFVEPMQMVKSFALDQSGTLPKLVLTLLLPLQIPFLLERLLPEL